MELYRIGVFWLLLGLKELVIRHFTSLERDGFFLLNLLLALGSLICLEIEGLGVSVQLIILNHGFEGLLLQNLFIQWQGFEFLVRWFWLDGSILFIGL